MITAIIQARMGSSRLPGKVMKPLQGKPIIYHVVERVRSAARVEQVIVATTDHEQDDPLAEYLASGVDMPPVATFRGAEDDVLDRYYQAALAFETSVILRVTADCPLIDPQVLDALIGLFQSGDYDYVSNVIYRTFPDGLDAEVFSFGALARTWEEAELASEREHVTPYIYKNPHLFRQVGLTQAVDMSAGRWTVDEPADYEFVARVYAALYPQNPNFGLYDVADLLAQQPELAAINSDIPLNEGYAKSLAAESTQEILLNDQGLPHQEVPPFVLTFQDEVRLFVHEALIPISAIRGYTDFLLMDLEGRIQLSEAERRDFLHIIRRAGQSSTAFILNMAEIVQFERDSQLELSYVTAESVVQHVLERAEQRIRDEKRVLQIKKNLADDLPPLITDEYNVHRILGRVLDNAILYSADGQEIHFNIYCADPPDAIIFEVQDFGIGIPEDEQAQIFERYHRGKHEQVSETAGSGMGLSIAKLYTEALQGSIWFESVPDQSTTFYVKIPLRMTQATNSAPNSNESAKKATSV